MKEQNFSWEGDVNLHAYQDFLTWEDAATTDWSAACKQQVLRMIDSLQQSDEERVPACERASKLSEVQASRYPEWQQPFKAGQLLSDERAWRAVFQREGATIPRKLQRWLRNGYGVFLELQQQGKQPGPNKLTADEL